MKQSHRIWSTNEIGEFLLETPHLANSRPCDVQTNVHIAHTAAPQLNRIFDQLVPPLSDARDGWFIALRNCDFAATKASRPLWPRPPFVPLHMRPFHTSWLIVAAGRYRARDAKPLALRGLVAVAQLTERRVFELTAAMGTADCGDVCEPLTVELWPGETLVFVADQWRVRWTVKGAQGQTDWAVTYVAEFDWDASRW